MNINKKYMIIKVEDLSLIDFNNVLETSIDTVRLSVDGTKTFVKWNGDTPHCISNIEEYWGPYTHNEILDIMNSSEWINETQNEIS
jgi:hypothetical protein